MDELQPSENKREFMLTLHESYASNLNKKEAIQGPMSKTSIVQIWKYVPMYKSFGHDSKTKYVMVNKLQVCSNVCK